MRNNKLLSMTIAALLCAVGIVIPIISPIKITLEPASFTLASHVAIFIAMFVSPFTALFVAAGTALGFLLAGFPIVVVMRAATHIIFALVGALVLKKYPEIVRNTKKTAVFSFAISILHGLCEIMVVMPFYFGNSMSAGYYSKGFFTSVILLVGVGTIVHSIIDYFLAHTIWKNIEVAVKVPHISFKKSEQNI